MDIQQDNIDWQPLESNSEVVNEYIQTLGTSQKLTFYDVYSFDEEDLNQMPQPVLGALFAFPYTQQIKDHMVKYAQETQQNQNSNESMYKIAQQHNQLLKLHYKRYYMKQTAQNACGTIGLLHILLNLQDTQQSFFEENGFISRFYKDTINLNSDQRAEKLQKNKTLNEMHKKAVHQGAIPVNNDIEYEHHFLAFVWKNGYIYELDGTKQGPIRYEQCDQSQFLLKTAQICQKHYISFASNEAGFNLMALTIEE